MKMVNSLTADEVEMLILMAKAHESHAERCDRIANRRMAEKQRERDLAKAALLRRIADDLRPM